MKRLDSKRDDIKFENDIIADTQASLSADFSTAQTLDNSIFELQTQIMLANDLENNLKAVSKKAELISLDTGIADSGVSRQIEAYNTAYLEYQKIAAARARKTPSSFP